MTRQSVRECPNCGGSRFVDVTPGKSRCEYCGTFVTSPRQTLGLLACTRCGFLYERGTRYCGECGLALTKWAEGEKPKADLAIVSIVASVIGTFFIPIGAPILGLILAYKARNQARATGGRSGSEDLARIAIIVGWVVLGTSVVPTCAFPLLLGGQLGLSICGAAIQLPAMLVGG